MRLLSAVVVVAACSRAGSREVEHRPTVPIVAVAPSALCVTMGALADAHVDAPTFRAVAPEHAGDAVSLRFRLRGDSTEHRALASGQLRRQLGLKLRAADGCNLVYVMWRLDPRPAIEVSVKRNPGVRTGRECGNAGYTKLSPAARGSVPLLDEGSEHDLRAEITGDTLVAWIDDVLVWRGTLPDSAREIDGASGVRSDNLAFDIVDFSVDARTGTDARATCHPQDDDD